jgi:RIO kinase 1
MPSHDDHASALQPFIDDGWITDILNEVKSGKEATVFCCRGGPRSPVPLIAAKVHRPIETRRFRNDAVYVGGRMHVAREGRALRALRGKSAFGRTVQYATWIAQEWETLNLLSGARISVPTPLAVGERAVIMEFVGDESGPAPMLHEIRPDRASAERLADQLLSEIEHMLDLDVVHADLSAFNVMLHGGRAVIIDFPQAIDPRLNHAGQALLARDVERVCAWAGKHGVTRSAGEITQRLWSRFVLGEIG